MALPFVALNRQVEWATSGVTVDDQGASRMAVDHFVSLGHRRIGHITGSLRTDTGMRRERGFLLGADRERADARRPLARPGRLHRGRVGTEPLSRSPASLPPNGRPPCSSGTSSRPSAC